MTRTKALVVVGCIMLALAAMAVMELKKESSATPEGQIVTGSISMTAPPQTAAPATAPAAPATQPNAADSAAQTPKNGALVSLDAGTLHTDNSAPASTPAPADRPATSPAPTVSATPSAPAPAAPVKEPGLPAAPAVKPEPVKPAAASAEPVRTEAVKPEVVKTEPVKKEPEKTVAATEAPKSEKTPEAAKSEPAKSEPAKQESGKTETRNIDTAGPVKVDPGQKAIVWTRMELSDKSVVFRMSGAENLEAKTFVLPNPDRFVVDLQGEWAMRLPTVPANPFLRKIRVGKQENNTRMVMDLAGTYNCQMVRINPTTLEFRIR